MRWTLRALVVLLPLGAVAWALLASSWLAVDRVEVVGQGRVGVDQVRAAAAVEPGTPLARVDTAAVAARVTSLAPVAEAQVTRSWPGTLRIVLTERVPVAGVVTPAGVRLVDAAGVLFDTAPALPDGLLRLQTARPGPGDPATVAALQVERDLPDDLRQRVRIVRAASASSVVLLLADGRRVEWGPPGDTAVKAAAATALLPLGGAVVDVSTPGVAVRR